MISIVTVSHNSWKSLDRLHRSLQDLPLKVEHEWIVVDNGSGRLQTLDLLDRIMAGDAAVIRLPENTWFTGGCNIGIAASRGDKILLLNPDCQAIEVGWLDAMVETANRPKVGVVGAVLVNETGMVVHAGGTGFGEHIGYGYTYSRKLPCVAEQRIENGWVTGACMLINRAALDLVGGKLDESRPHYHSDRALCEAVRGKGYEVWLSSAVLVHSVGGSAL